MAAPTPIRPTISARGALALTGLLWRLRNGVVEALARTPPDHPMRRAHATLRRIGPVQALWRRWIFTPAGRAIDPAAYAAAGGAFLPARAIAVPPSPATNPFDALVDRAEQAETPYEPVAGRIVMVNCGLACGGAERQIVALLNGLLHRGADVIFLGEGLGRAPGLDFHAAAVPGDRVFPTRRSTRIDGRLYAGVTRPVAEALECLPQPERLEVLDMVTQLRALRPSVLHLWQDQTSVKHGLAGLIAGTPRIILGGRNVDPSHFAYDQPWLRPGYQALARSPRVRLTNNSEAGARSYAGWLGLAQDRITVVRNGVDLPRAGPAQLARAEALRREWGALGVPLVGSAIRLASEKRPLLLLEAMAELARRRPDCRFVIAGDGPLRTEVEGAVAALGLAGRLTLLGEVADIAPVLLALDLIMLTSEFEGTPNTLLEAQWFGRPVLVTEAGGAAEAIDAGVTGLVVAADPLALAGAANAILSDPAWSARAAEGGEAFVAQRYGAARMIDEMQALYASGSGGGPSVA